MGWSMHYIRRFHLVITGLAAIGAEIILRGPFDWNIYKHELMLG
jgi:hypothetical protein